MSQDQAQEVLESAVKNQPKKRGCLRGCHITVLVLAFPVWWFCFHTTPLRVSKETTYALGPMTSDGKRIDYFRAIEDRFYPPEMKTDDNGYRMMVRALGDPVKYDNSIYGYEKNEVDPESFRLQVYEKLGLDPNEKPALKLESADTFMERYAKDRPEDKEIIDRFYRSQRERMFEDFPMLKDWLDDNTAGMNLLAEAVRKPAFCIPYVRENENTDIFEACRYLEKVQVMREWGRAVSARAYYRLGVGNIDGAIDDIVTLHYLSRHAGKQGTLVSWLVGFALEGLARSIGIGSNPEFPPTKEQIERFVTKLNALPPRWTLSEALESERYFGLAACQDLYWGNNLGFYDGPWSETLHPKMGWTIDINILLTRMNKIYDVLTGKETTVDGQPLEEILEPSWRNPLWFLSVRSRTDIFMVLGIPAIQAAREAQRREECTENMQRLTLALLLYEKDHGTLPDGDWREAIKPYLGDNPDQYFRCPSHRLAEGETAYAMIGNVPNPVASPNQILIVEVFQPQKLGEGDGRFPLGKVDLWGGKPQERCPDNFDGLGSYHAGGIVAGFRSGAVRFLSKSTEQHELRKLIKGTATSLP